MAVTTTLDKKTQTPLNSAKAKKGAEIDRTVPSDEPADRVRISFDVSSELNEKLQAMARDINGTKSEVLRKSLALLEVALEATRDGKKIGIADRSEQLTREIIGFRH